ncbi:MAG: glycyl-radical enzyme activating protein [Treponema sp.]|nr:glycyl-radical enzyme activating protein [Treponema sp.]
MGNNIEKISGRVLRIEKVSIHDGDGLRTVVFLKGCPLRCAWCATPESQSIEPESDIGVTSAGSEDPACKCTDMTSAEVVNEIAKDEIFFFHSGGGVTISGGEPLAQPEFTLAVIRECKMMGINTAIETCAFGDYSALEMLLPYLDTIYADIKFMDEELHIKWTGASNRTILSNITRISSDFAGKLRIRLPLVPTLNMDDNSIRATAEFCLSLTRLDFVEFLPYHRLGVDTYRKLGREFPLSHIIPPTDAELKGAAKVFRNAAPEIKLVVG